MPVERKPREWYEAIDAIIDAAMREEHEHYLRAPQVIFWRYQRQLVVLGLEPVELEAAERRLCRALGMQADN